MTTLHLAALILTAEFALLAWGILFVMLRRQRHQARADEAHAGEAIRHLEANEMSHRDALTKLFEDTYHLEGEALTAKVEEYLARERAFYNVMLNLYLNRDGARLKEIPAELAKVIKPWAEITPAGMISASTVSTLEDEKAQLLLELDNTKRTLEQLMEEYMAAFKKTEQKTIGSVPKSERAPATPEVMVSEDIDLEAHAMAAADFDIQPATANESKEAPGSQSPDGIEPKEAIEERPDPNDIDAMLEAMAQEALGQQGPATDTPDEGRESPPSPKHIEEVRASEELEGLADLFDPPPKTERPAR
ncbi:MAG: hypothetical protein ACUVT0_08785 [Thermochromatium sp.]